MMMWRKLVVIVMVSVLAFCGEFKSKEELEKLHAFCAEKHSAIMEGTEPATWDELVARVATVMAKYPGVEKVARPVEFYCLPYACWHCGRKLWREGYAAAVSLDVAPQIYRFISVYREKLVLSDAEVYAKLLGCFFNEVDPLLPQDYVPCFELMMTCALAVDDAQVLADLRHLNRYYTAKLVKEREKWEPLVVAIRTSLETYK